MLEIDLKPDCRHCEALCCVLLPFDAGPAFGFDKAAGEMCRHLGADRRCSIHSSLIGQGFSGCAAYSCLGAGQRVTALLIAGRPWRDDPDRRAAVEDGFRGLRQVHEVLAMLKAAGRLDLPPEVEAERQLLVTRLDAGRDWTLDDLVQAMSAAGILAGCRRFLAKLRDLAGLTTPLR